MLSALITFLGGSVFRMIWGEVSSYLSKKQDHAQEIERMRLQVAADNENHKRSLENMRLQSELGIKQVEVQKELTFEKGEADGWVEAQRNAFKATGIMLVDAWNGIIRPAYATIALGLWVLKLQSQGYKMDDFDMSMLGVVSGFFFADRSLRKNGRG